MLKTRNIRYRKPLNFCFYGFHEYHYAICERAQRFTIYRYGFRNE